MATLIKHALSSRRYYLSSCRKCLCRNKLNSFVRREFHTRKPLLTSSSSQGPLGFKDQALKLAVYGSFAAGGIILSAVIFRELKDFYRKHNGIFFQDIREWGRLRPYLYRGFLLPERIVSIMNDIEKFETSPDDIWIVAFPRSGSTWLQEIVNLINCNMDIESACSRRLDERSPHLEFPKPGISAIQSQPVPRLIKTHLPYSLLPTSVKDLRPKDTCFDTFTNKEVESNAYRVDSKVTMEINVISLHEYHYSSTESQNKCVCIMTSFPLRDAINTLDPKDVVVSYFFYTRLLHPLTRYTGEFPEFFKLFLEDKVMYGPWSDHVLEFWDRRQEENILYLTYEDLKKDTSGCIDQIATFLGKTVTADQKQQIIEHCSFESMKSNPQTNHSWLSKEGLAKEDEGDFFRKGCIGDWGNHFSDTMGTQMNTVLLSKFVNSDFNLTYCGLATVTDEDNTG